jgi:hypothetical protein
MIKSSLFNRRHRAGGGMIQKRIAIVVAAGLIDLFMGLIILNLIISGQIPANSRELQIQNPLASMLAGLIVLEILYRTSKWLSLRTLVIYILGTAILIRWLHVLVFFLYGPDQEISLVNGGLYLLSLDILLFLFWPAYPNAYPFNLAFWSEAVIVIGIAYGLLRARLPAPAAAGVGQTGVVTYGGAEMDPARSQITRYLSASVLFDPVFRQKVISMVKDDIRALAPELGLDLAKLARLSYLLQARDARYNLIFSGITLVGLVLYAIFSLPVALVIFLPAAWAAYFYKSHEQRYKLVPLLAKEGYDPAQLEALLISKYRDQALPRLMPEADQNLVVYSGFSPFVGAGSPLGRWSFPIDVSRPKENMGLRLEIKPFELAELYQAVEQGLGNCQIKGFVAKDFLFANGQQIRDQDWILPTIFSHPVYRVDDARVQHYLGNNDPRVRYYKWLRVFDWGNEIVISYFVRFSRQGNHLFVGVDRFLLTPLAETHHWVDTMQAPTGFTPVNMGLAAIFAAPFAVVGGALAILDKIYELFGKLFDFEERAKLNEIENDLQFDYGVGTSLRQQASGPVYQHYFQMLDQEMYIKILDRQLLETLTTFLDEHHIDTSDVKERQTTILNSGLIVQGGEVKAEALAVGSSAQASVSQSARTGGG